MFIRWEQPTLRLFFHLANARINFLLDAGLGGVPHEGNGWQTFLLQICYKLNTGKKTKKNQVESCPLSKIKLEFVDFVHALAPRLVQPHSWAG